MHDDQPRPRESGRRAADTDVKVWREYEALNGLLAGLARRIDEPTLPQVAESDESERVVRWVAVLQGIRRLTEAVAIREELLKVPFCIAARVTDVTADETRVVLTITAAVTMPELQALLNDSLAMVGSSATLASVTKHTPVAG